MVPAPSLTYTIRRLQGCSALLSSPTSDLFPPYLSLSNNFWCQEQRAWANGDQDLCLSMVCSHYPSSMIFTSPRRKSRLGITNGARGNVCSHSSRRGTWFLCLWLQKHCKRHQEICNCRALQLQTSRRET